MQKKLLHKVKTRLIIVELPKQQHKENPSFDKNGFFY